MLRTSLTRALVAPSRTTTTTLRRTLHQRVQLPYDLEQGLAPFLSPTALKTIAVDWQEGVLKRLNELVDGTEFEGLSALQTVKQTASDPTQSLTFNYASEALNNSFFLSTLSPSPRSPNPQSLLSQRLTLTPSLSSLSGLISHFSSHIDGLHPSSGAYVWLICDKNGNLGVVGTYAGGSMLVSGREQRGLRNGAEERVLGEKLGSEKEDGGETSGSAWESLTSPRRQTSTFLDSQFSVSSSFSNNNKPPTLHPLLALSVHPHCYLGDYGVWGREEYVKNWWAKIDWEKVETSYKGFVSSV